MGSYVSLRLPSRGLYAITDDNREEPEVLSQRVAQAIEGGAVLVQYRDKSRSYDSRLHMAKSLRRVCGAMAVPFIVNDDLELAVAVDANGLHLGEDDVDYQRAREVLGPQRIIGVSCYNSLPKALSVQALGADYVAFGSLFSSTTKPNASRASLTTIREARKRITIPIAAIGGLTPENSVPVIEAGVDFLAVISGVFAHKDLQSAARRYADLFASFHCKESQDCIKPK